jgi:hypothetical protein
MESGFSCKADLYLLLVRTRQRLRLGHPSCCSKAPLMGTGKQLGVGEGAGFGHCQHSRDRDVPDLGTSTRKRRFVRDMRSDWAVRYSLQLRVFLHFDLGRALYGLQDSTNEGAPWTT